MANLVLGGSFSHSSMSKNPLPGKPQSMLDCITSSNSLRQLATAVGPQDLRQTLYIRLVAFPRIRIAVQEMPDPGAFTSVHGANRSRAERYSQTARECGVGSSTMQRVKAAMTG
jgi:hypothetical protein